MIRVTDNHEVRMERVAPLRVLPALGEELLFGAETIAEDAASSIRDGAVSGARHVPAPPGGPPNADTHDLDQSIRPIPVEETAVSVQTGVISDSDHALYQERGTSKMLARPFLEPATERHRVDIVQALGKRYRELLAG